MSDASFAHCRGCRQPEYACDCGPDSTLDDAAHAINLLVNARDEIELAMRVPGTFITITRQSLDSVLNDLGVVGRLIRQLAERS
jgi:hypothetical protein